jgi:hypothetical protein
MEWITDLDQLKKIDKKAGDKTFRKKFCGDQRARTSWL